MPHFAEWDTREVFLTLTHVRGSSAAFAATPSRQGMNPGDPYVHTRLRPTGRHHASSLAAATLGAHRAPRPLRHDTATIRHRRSHGKKALSRSASLAGGSSLFKKNRST